MLQAPTIFEVGSPSSRPFSKIAQSSNHHWRSALQPFFPLALQAPTIHFSFLGSMLHPFSIYFPCSIRLYILFFLLKKSTYKSWKTSALQQKMENIGTPTKNRKFGRSTLQPFLRSALQPPCHFQKSLSAPGPPFLPPQFCRI